LATSVIEVGVDVERLGLLTIVRQPKTTAQYIQVAGRVGRNSHTGPGLVVTLLNPLASRDVSHYERFTSVHARLYAAVEPASVTPFTDAALGRGLRGAIAAVVRQIRPHTDAVTLDDVAHIGAAATALSLRAGQINGPRWARTVDALAAEARAEVDAAIEAQLPWGRAGRRGVQFLRALGVPAPDDLPSWPVLTSLRSVDADAALRIEEDWLPARATSGMTEPRGDADPQTEEDW
jgi:superfamily II DNA or RNA helicase